MLSTIESTRSRQTDINQGINTQMERRSQSLAPRRSRLTAHDALKAMLSALAWLVTPSSANSGPAVGAPPAHCCGGVDGQGVLLNQRYVAGER